MAAPTIALPRFVLPRSGSRGVAHWIGARPLAVALVVVFLAGLPAALITLAGRGAAEAELVARVSESQQRLAAAGAGAVADTLRQFQTRLHTVADSRLAQV